MRVAEQQARAFASEYPIAAVLGIDDDSTIVAAHIANALGTPHNSVESVKGGALQGCHAAGVERPVNWKWRD